jgi:hypothetical protein
MKYPLWRWLKASAPGQALVCPTRSLTPDIKVRKWNIGVMEWWKNKITLGNLLVLEDFLIFSLGTLDLNLEYSPTVFANQ